MAANQVTIQTLLQPDRLQAQHTIHMMAILQSELATLQAKVATYYQDEIVLRGDKIMMREYCGYFGIAPNAPGTTSH